MESKLRTKVDPITALQDGIDGLSLAMFEALRGLRDAVAPESGNLGGNNNPASTNSNANNGSNPSTGGGVNANESSSSAGEQPDMDELWNLYRSGDKEVTAKVQKFVSSSTSTVGGIVQVLLPQKREDFVRLHAKMEMEKDTELVTRLASTVLEKSSQIDEQLDGLPGMNRTRDGQMKIIEGLIALNQKASQDLHKAYREAVERRAACRHFIQSHTCTALGIDEEPERPDT